MKEKQKANKVTTKYCTVKGQGTRKEHRRGREKRAETKTEH